MQRGSKNDTAANSVIVEYGDWNSHKLTSWVTTILLREKLGYRTAMVLLAVLLPHARRSLARYSWRIVSCLFCNDMAPSQIEHVDPVNTFERLGIGGRGVKRTHINAEVWLDGKRPKLREWVHSRVTPAHPLPLPPSPPPRFALGLWCLYY